MRPLSNAHVWSCSEQLRPASEGQVITLAKNLLGRMIPEQIAGLGKLRPYQGIQTRPVRGVSVTRPVAKIRANSKLLTSLEQAIRATRLSDGMTISFHHHFREGDYLVNQVVDIIAELGFKDICLAPSSLTNVHDPLIRHIQSGVITRIETSGLRGQLGKAISSGVLQIPVIIRSHGGRARAIEAGALDIDVAFLGVPACDCYGNANGISGPSICGSLGYAQVDALFAKQVVLVTDQLVNYPNLPASIPQTVVDYVVQVDKLGDPQGIMSGATRFTSNPRDLLMAEHVAKVITSTDYFRNGFSIQFGSGGASLAAARFLREQMLRRRITAGFILGGITGQCVEMLEAGLVERLLDVQSFDLIAARSLGGNPQHTEIDASFYANPSSKGCAVDQLDTVILSALEIDTDFNVNVITGSDGVIRGASGGHSDTAAGAKLAVVVAPLIRGRMPIILDRVNTVVTPGSSIDVLVTDYGVAINPLRDDLRAQLAGSGLPIFTIQELQRKAESITGKPAELQFGDQVVGVVEYRDGSVIDVIRASKS